MIRNKKLQKYADKSLSSLQDEAFLKTLQEGSKQTHSSEKMSRKTIFAISSSLCFAVIVVALLCVFLIEPQVPNDEYGDSKFYAVENQRTAVSSIEEVNNNSESIGFKETSGIAVKRVVDISYDETLYFVVECNNEETMETVSIFVVVNNEYTLPFSIAGEKISDNINKYTISYTESYTEEDGLFYVDSVGEICTQNERVYVRYSGISLEKSNNFLTYLRNIIQ